MRHVILLLLAIAAFLPAPAQEVRGEVLTADASKSKPVRKPGSAWTLGLPLGEHIPSTIDTLQYNYQRQAIPSLTSDAWLTTGNLGAPGMNLIYFDRVRRSDFFFADVLSYVIPQADAQKFYNVYIPMTLLSYNTGGSKQNVQDRLRATFAGNVNRRIGINASLDYLYSKGSYENQATKDFIYGLGGYYNGHRYDLQAFVNLYNLVNKENGGITDDLYITDPAQLQGGVSKIEPKSIPVRLQKAHSRISGADFLLSHAFKIGYEREVQVNDTLSRMEYVPVTKFIHTLRFRRNRHVFDNVPDAASSDFWTNNYLSSSRTHDDTRQWSLSNTLGITTVEGFRPWAKFALAAYATYEIEHTYQTPYDPDAENADLAPLPFAISRKHNDNRLWVGGNLDGHAGKVLTYSAAARFGIVGSVAGDIDLHASLSTRFRMLGDTVSLSASGSFRNTAQPYLLQHYYSNHFAWNNDFGKTRRFQIEGKLTIPWTRTEIGAGVENVQNLVYFGPQSLPVQHSGSVQVFSARIHQPLRLGIWNWDNTVTVQTSTDSNVIPLPAFVLYSNMYLNFTAFRVLHMQIGVDCNYFTRYNAMGYQPATMSFHTLDNGTKAGNYAFANAYLTCKLYKVRFFVMLSHANQGWFSSDYFAMPGYPLNPRKFQIGLSVDFAN